jgi:gliding motility-associated-like protein
LFSANGALPINASTGEIDLSLASAGEYIVTYTIPASDCTAETSSDFTLTLTEIITPELGFTYASPVCSNATENPEPITIAGFAFGGGFSSTDGLAINAQTGVIDLSASTAGTYTITYTYNPDASTCESAGETTATITITPAAVIVTDFTYPTPVCASSAAINPTGVAGFTTGGSFSSSAGLNINAQSGSIEVSTSTPGTYVITYRVEATECTPIQESTFTLTINALSTPQLGFSYTTPVCSSDSNPSPALSAGFTTGGTFSSSTAVVDAQSGVVNLAQTPAGEHVITYTLAQNNTTCTAAGSATATIVVNTSFTPATGFAYAPEYCFGDNNDTPALASGFFAGGTFTATGGLGINAQTGEITLSGAAAGSYTVTYTVAPNQVTCNLGGSSSFSFTVSAAIEVEVTGECDGPAYFLTAAPISGSYNPDQATYVWRDASGNQVGSNSPTFNVSTYVANNPVLLPSSFSVTVSYNGCQGTQAFVVNSISCIIQRGISPNNDGDNDFFDLRGYNVRTLSIFNRYGRNVYSRASYSDQWVGQSDKGDELPDGTYFYVIDFADSESITGWIYINRQQ